MNKQLLRKLMAGLLVCAMLLASVAAFADDENPVDTTTATTTEDVENNDAGDTTPGNSESTGTKTESTDPASSGSEDDEDVDTGNDEDVDTNNDEDVDTNKDEDVDTEKGEDVDTEKDEGEDVDTEKDEGEDVDTEKDEGEGEDEVKPVAPPINFGGVPNVEGAEGEGDNADTENGIAPLYFHKHEHNYVQEGDYEYDWSEYIWVSDSEHTRIDHYYVLMICEGCSDERIDSVEQEAGNYKHVDDDGDGICDLCEGPATETGDGQDEVGHDPAQEPTCTHPDVTDWKVIYKYAKYDKLSSEGALYDTKTDAFDYSKKDSGQNESAGHTRYAFRVYSGYCDECGETVYKYEDERIFEPHTFYNGRCACGYRQPTAKKKEEDTRVRMGVKLMQEIRKLTKDGVTVSLRDEKLVYTEQEYAAVQAISDPFERMLMMLAALGYGDEVEHAIKYQGLDISDEALALIKQLGDRDPLPGTAEVFLSTEKVKGTEREVVTISLVLSGNGVATKSYSFYKDGSNFYFFD